MQRVDRQHVLLFLGAAQQHRAQRPGRRGPGDDVEQRREQAAGQHVLGGAVPGGVRRAGADIAQRGDGELLPASGHPAAGKGVTERRDEQGRVEGLGRADHQGGGHVPFRAGPAGAGRPPGPPRRGGGGLPAAARRGQRGEGSRLGGRYPGFHQGPHGPQPGQVGRGIPAVPARAAPGRADSVAALPGPQGARRDAARRAAPLTVNTGSG